MTLPGRGETVGEAFIRIRADGSGLDESIRREWGKHDEIVQAAGRRDADKYGKAVDKEFKSVTGKKLEKSLQDAYIKGAASDKFLTSTKWKNFKERLEREYGEAGRLAGKRLGDSIAQGADLKSLSARLKNVRAEVARATSDIQRAEQTASATRVRLAQSERDTINRIRLDEAKSAGRLEDTLLRLVRKRFDAVSGLSRGAAERDRERLLSTITKLSAAARLGDRAALHALHDLHAETKLFIKDGEQGFLRLNGRIKESVRDMTDSERRLARLEQRIRGLNIGKLFGAGARNNFFNALGLAVGGFAEAIALAGVRARRVFADVRGDLAATERGFKGLAQKAEVLGATFVRALGKVLVAPVGLFGGLNALNLIAGPLAAAISMLSGVIVALISTIGLGLVGAIGAALPVMGVFAIGVAVMTVALGHLNKAQKDILKKRLGPIVKDFRELRSATRDALFSGLNKQVPILHHLLEGQVKPLFTTTAKAISRSWTAALKVIDGKTMAKNFAALRHFAPGAIEKLGKILTNSFVSLSGIMRAAVPIANRLLDSLVKSSQRFANLINSGKGQNHLQVFFINAYASARRLWRFLRDLGKVLFDILKGGQRTGDNIFDSMNKSLERFDRFLRSGKGRLAMTNWFNASRTFLTALGRFTAGVAHLFASLDSSQTRGILNALLTGIGRLFTFIGDLLPNIQHFQTEIGRLLGPILSLLEPIAKILLGALADGTRILSTLITPLADGLHKLVDDLGPLKGVLVGLLAPLAAFALAIKGLKLIGLGGLLTVLGGTTLGTRIGLWGLGIQSALGRVTTRIRTARLGLTRTLGGLALALSATSLAGAAGGLNTTGGKLADAAANIFGGALVGSVFGPLGAAIGAVGGSIKTVIDLFHASGDAAKAASDKAIAAMQAERAAASQLADAIANQGLKAAITQQVWSGIEASIQTKNVKGKPETTSLLDFSSSVGIPLRVVNQAALGSTTAMNTFLNALNRGEHQGKISGDEYVAMSDALSRLVGISFDGEKTFEQQAVATGHLRFAMIPLRKEARQFGTDLTALNSGFSQRNRFVITQHAAALRNHAIATSKDGKSALIAAGNFLIQERNLRRAAIAAGFDKGEVEKLTARFQKIPLKITTQLRRIGVTGGEILDIINKYGRIPKSLLTTINKKGVTPGEIQRIIDKLLGIPKHHNTIINVDATDANAKINALNLRLAKLGNRTINIPAVPTAAGALVNGPQLRLIGEAGPEAVVPLRRPLSQVDPSVRALSAMAQGMNNGPSKMARGGVIGGGKTINVEQGAITVISPTTDPVATAEVVLSRLSVIGGYQ